MNRVYFAVYNKLQKDPLCVEGSLFWAHRFIKEQQKTWPLAKFRIEKVEKLIIGGKVIKSRGIMSWLSDLLKG